MKVIFVFEVDEQDDVDRLATDLISHHLIQSVKYVPELHLRMASSEAINEALSQWGQRRSPLSDVADAIIDCLLSNAPTS